VVKPKKQFPQITQIYADNHSISAKISEICGN